MERAAALAAPRLAATELSVQTILTRGVLVIGALLVLAYLAFNGADVFHAVQAFSFYRPPQLMFGQLLLGLINGAFYALLSLGLAVIFGMLNIINFAHGAYVHAGRVRSLDDPGVRRAPGSP